MNKHYVGRILRFRTHTILLISGIQQLNLLLAMGNRHVANYRSANRGHTPTSGSSKQFGNRKLLRVDSVLNWRRYNSLILVELNQLEHYKEGSKRLFK